MNRSAAIVLAFLALLLLGGRGRDLDPAPVQLDPVPVAVAPPAVPLAISETTPPPGWDPPDTAEEQIVDWFGELGRAALGQLAFAVAGVIVVLGLMYYAERRRAG